MNLFWKRLVNKRILKKIEPISIMLEKRSGIGKTKYYLKRRVFCDRINTIKKGLEKSVSFYPYSILSNLDHLDNLLHDIGLQTEDVLAARTVNDIGGADGDLAFYCEFLGAEKVNLIDHAPTNFNQLKGATKLKEVLTSKVNIFDIDLHNPNGWQSVEESQISIFLGILYHLQNPFLALSELSKKSKYLLISTKVFDVVNSQDVSSTRCAYFYNPGECNQDPTNWWCFTDECLRSLIERSGWEIISYKRIGCENNAEPADIKKDGRAFAYLKSKISV